MLDQVASVKSKTRIIRNMNNNNDLVSSEKNLFPAAARSKFILEKTW